MDIWSQDRSLNNGNLYDPCHNSDDPDYGACEQANVAPTSYYRVFHYSPTARDFPYGMFIANTDPNRCRTSSWCRNKGADTLIHLAADRVDGAAIEIYPYGSRGTYEPREPGAYAGVRVQVDEFPHAAHGGAYSAPLGTIELSKLGDKGMAKLNGYVFDRGRPLSGGDVNRVRIDLFQQGRAPRFTSTGYPMRGFASVHNDKMAYYNGGAVYGGSYDIYVWDTKTDRRVMLTSNLVRTDERIDFELDKPCFGRPPCRVIS